MSSPNDLGDRVAGCLLGQALADAVGFVVEAEPPEALPLLRRGEADLVLGFTSKARYHASMFRTVEARY